MIVDDAILTALHRAMDLPGRPADHRVVVAMSGGVDSTATAGLLRAAGYDVVGVTMRLAPEAAALPPPDGGGDDARGVTAPAPAPRACCSGRDVIDARLAANALGIPHYVLDMRELFATAVVEAFADAYLRGETPVPCAECNRVLKFDALLAHAREIGASALVTGHYVASRRLDARPPRRGLFTPADMDRDQSYFLFSVPQEQLDFLRFPLAAFAKAEVRALAAALGLKTVADKPASQDICFVPPGGYRRLLDRLRPGAHRPGPIRHVDGRLLGRHDGIAGFTIGQRRGLGISLGEPLYVVAVDAASDTVIVGPKAALARRALRLRAVNWLGDAPLPETPSAAIALHVKIRSTRPPVAARLWATEAGGAVVELAAPEYGVAPGQACVFYARPGPHARVLGGGTIAAAAASVTDLP